MREQSKLIIIQAIHHLSQMIEVEIFTSELLNR